MSCLYSRHTVCVRDAVKGVEASWQHGKQKLPARLQRRLIAAYQTSLLTYPRTHTHTQTRLWGSCGNSFVRSFFATEMSVSLQLLSILSALNKDSWPFWNVKLCLLAKVQFQGKKGTKGHEHLQTSRDRIKLQIYRLLAFVPIYMQVL